MEPSWPLFAAHALESLLVFRGGLWRPTVQLTFEVAAGRIRTTWTLAWALATTGFLLIKEYGNRLNEQFAIARNKREHFPIQSQADVLAFVIAVFGALIKQLPCLAEVVAHVKQAPAGTGEPALGRFTRRPTQAFSALARGVVDVQDEIAQGVHVEVVVLRGHLDAPPADSSAIFERQVAVVAEVDFEETRIVYAAGGRDRFPRAPFSATQRGSCGHSA